MKNTRLVITGNPGVGKHTSARLVAAKLGAEIIDINEVAIKNNTIFAKTDHGLDVDIKKLTDLIAAKLKTKKNLIIVGHLSPYVLKPTGIDLVAVLRRSPYELATTLEKRKYPAGKIKENVASEILGVTLYDSLKAFGRKVAEFDTTDKPPQQTASEILSTLKGKSKRQIGVVDWLSLVAKKKDIEKFFDY